MPEVMSLDYVLAQWAYSELLSREQGDKYQGPGVSALRMKARRGVKFDELDHEERGLLLKGWHGVRGGGTIFANALAGVTAFRVTHWTKDDLGLAYIIGHFFQWLPPTYRSRPITFREWVGTEPHGILSEHHPLREAATAGSFFRDENPITVTRLRVLLGVGELHAFTLLNEFQGFVLLDGYHRAVKFWTTKDAAATLAVYVPLEVQ